jgi:GTP-binding GTPase N-terminal
VAVISKSLSSGALGRTTAGVTDVCGADLGVGSEDGRRFVNVWLWRCNGTHHVCVKQYRSLVDPLHGADVVVVGLFSAKDAQYEIRLAELVALVEARGGRVVSRYVQRRGASDRWNERPGGAARMSQPFSRRTLLTNGKVREIAEACREANVDAAVFVNILTPVQRTVLVDMLSCLVFSGEDLAA